MFKKSLLLALAGAFAVSAYCEEPITLGSLISGSSGPKQEERQQFCLVRLADVIFMCPDNKLMFFAPMTYGNPQIPLMVIAKHCDEKKPIFYNESGVVCTKVAQKVTYDVAEEAKKTVWRNLKEEVQKPDSGWKKFNETGWVKVLKKETGEFPPYPFKMTLSEQELDFDGKAKGKAGQFTEEVKNEKDVFYSTYPVGTEFEAVWFPENLLECGHYKYKVLKVTPITEKAKEEEKPKAKKGKK